MCVVKAQQVIFINDIHFERAFVLGEKVNVVMSFGRVQKTCTQVHFQKS